MSENGIDCWADNQTDRQTDGQTADETEDYNKLTHLDRAVDQVCLQSLQEVKSTGHSQLCIGSHEQERQQQEEGLAVHDWQMLMLLR